MSVLIAILKVLAMVGEIVVSIVSHRMSARTATA